MKTFKELHKIRDDKSSNINLKTNKSDFYKNQTRILLKNCGVIDSENIDEYIKNDGYIALEKVLKKSSIKSTIEIIKKSNLRGRGGSGFLTGEKLEKVRKEKSDKKYIICNANESDPRTYIDRTILEENPQVILEAMIISGYLVGANNGYIYIRSDYKLAIEKIKKAIEQAKEYGILGKNVLSSGFQFNIEIIISSGAFICGEETALIESIEGKRGNPRIKPPYPSEKGLYGKPTFICNVETFANIPEIIKKEENWVETKIFALGGNVKNVGLVEVPLGTTLRKIIYDIGGGIPLNREFKAVQFGGPTGVCLSKEHLDSPLTYEFLQSINANMGSGGIIVLDDRKCMVNLAKFCMDFIVIESCGKCSPCRIGTKRMQELLEKICDGNATEKDLSNLEKLASNINKTSLCNLGKNASNPVLSTLKYFKDEYKEHITYKLCRTKECTALMQMIIDTNKCKGCGICQKNCPVNAIRGEGRNVRNINQKECIKCGTCLTKCPFQAIK